MGTWSTAGPVKQRLCRAVIAADGRPAKTTRRGPREMSRSDACTDHCQRRLLCSINKKLHARPRRTCWLTRLDSTCVVEFSVIRQLTHRDARYKEIPDVNTPSRKYRCTDILRYFVTPSIVDNFLKIARIAKRTKTWLGVTQPNLHRGA